MSDKIGPQHRSRKAILYIRQSSAQQVQHNEESRRMQYAMRERLQSLGWTDIEVIDEDLGRSAAGTMVRTGFERMVAQVCLGEVGAVAAREVSRFARNSREWQKLVEVCRVVDTLLIDHETAYDSRKSNDRLLLGLKGTLNEYELDLLRQRAWEARREKAERGELVVQPPVGFIKTPDQRLELDPDQRVREVIELIFRKCLEFGSARQCLMWLLDHDLKMPARRRIAGIWETRWKRPLYTDIHRMVTNPIYAGAYAYGRTGSSVEYQNGEPRKRTRQKDREHWSVLIRDHHAGYVSWTDFERLREMLAHNRQLIGRPGAAKLGPGLLVGLLRCRRCGRKLVTTYTGRLHNVPGYLCSRGYLDCGEPKCTRLGGLVADQAIAREIIRVLQPVAVSAAMEAGRQMSQGKLDEVRALERELTAARYEASRVERQFNAADPENRLVADELERRWNAALENLRQVELRLAQQHDQATELELPDLEHFTDLASDLERIWNHPDTDIRIKKRIVRRLIHEIVADVDRQAGEVHLVIHWEGGVHTELRVPIRMRGQNSRHTSSDTVEIVRQLALVCSDEVICAYLNRNGVKTGPGNRWTKVRLASLRNWHKIPAYSANEGPSPGWMTLTDAAAFVGVSTMTLRLAVERGEVPAKHPLPDGPWIFRREDLTEPFVKKLVERARRRPGTPAKPNPQQQNLDFSGT
jgi:DNA invertase Pin-like site-specific DNA recombinase